MPWKYAREPKSLKDVAFFRMGYLNYMKLNTVNMVELSVGETWYKVDLLVNWDDQRVAIYVNDKFKASSPFFNNEKERVESANVLSIYGLSAGGTSRFRAMEVCTEICATGKSPTHVPPASGVPRFESVFKVVTDPRSGFIFCSFKSDCTLCLILGDATKLDMKHTNQEAGATSLLAFNVMTTAAAIALMLAA